MNAWDMNPALDERGDGRWTAREWRGRVRAHDTDAYAGYLRRTGLADYAATPGHRGTLVLLDRGAEVAEFTVLTLWESERAIRAFAGDDLARARYYPDDASYLLELPEAVRHYRVLDHAITG